MIRKKVRQAGLTWMWIIVSVASFPLRLSAQKEYTLNSPGNVCYIRYITVAPDSAYDSVKRPFIFLLGKENESAAELIARDTLRKQPEFHDYKFIYIPNLGGDAQQKLQCIASLSSLVTSSFRYGKVNLFLRVDDRTIEEGNITEYRLNGIFRKIRLSSIEAQTQVSVTPSTGILEDFKEKYVQYEPMKKEETATFYSDAGAADTSDISQEEEKPHKVYFGPPVKKNFTFSGTVKDKTTGEALPFATVSIKGTVMGTTSNNDGYFTLVKVPADTSTIIVQYVGYEKTELFLTPETQVRNNIIELNPASQRLQGVVVTARKNQVTIAEKENISIVKITPKNLEQLPGLGEKDVMRSFQLMPGVSASNEASSGLYVRGGTPDQNLVVYDGFTVYHVDHLYGFFSAFNSNALKDFQLYKGGFESKFGGRLSSVTEITGKDGNQKRINVGGEISLLAINGYAEVPVGKKFSSIIAYRRSYQGSIYNSIFEKFNTGSTVRIIGQGADPGRRFSQNSNIKSFFYDLNGKFTYRSDEKNIISLSIYNGTDKLDNGLASSAPSFGNSGMNFNMNSTDITRYGNVGTSLKWSRKWNDKLYGNTILSYSNYYSTRNRSQQRTIFNTSGEAVTTNQGVFEDNNLRDYSFKSDYRYDLDASNQVQFGLFATWYDIKYTYAENDTSTILNRHNTGLLTGFYIQDELKLLNNKLRIIPGIRSNYYGVTGRPYIEPRASISYDISNKFVFKATAGKFYQFANRVTREDIMSGSRDFWILADGSFVPVSSAVHVIAGITYETNDYVFSAEGYYKWISNLTEHSLRINASPLGVNYNENFFSGYGFARGIEFLAQKKSGNLNGWISYTIGQARNHFTEYSDSYYPADQDVTHEFKVVSLYKWKRFDFSANWIFATGRPYTAPSGAYSIKLLDGTTRDYFTVTSKNSLRLPDYHRLDVAVTYKLLAGWRGEKRRREIGYIGLSVFNLYNHLNVWYKQFTIEDGAILESSINYLGFTPNLTLSLKLR